ncbi:putative siderochrome-iron [Diplodia seriata]|uniref:Putative siderochrome-iron n=1 Tax=Diplodia seriata TaxID=420778 RepID=A0A0G2FMN7_9PEZI|nr:putative siderochrome-iron [Diplodia seriata]OMP82052.1 Siderophore iron transporter mirB [Diplodia seriata]
MGILDNVRGRKDAVVAEAAVQPAQPPPYEPKADYTVEHPSDTNSDTLSLEARNEREVEKHPDEVTKNVDQGVQKVEAAALVWTKKTVYCIYAWIWVCFFMLAFQQSIANNVNYYAYSGFSAAPQISTANILSNIVGGILRLPAARILNVWGRAEGLFIFTCVYLLGMIIIAACNGPDGYAAGYTLYWIGYDCIYIILDIFIADTSGLKNRAFAFGFVTTPFICTAFTGPLAAQSFLAMTSFRWAYGAFCIIQCFVFFPLVFVFKMYQKKAERLGIYKKEASGRSWIQSTVHYIQDFDIIGCLIIIAAFVLFLLPFSLTSYSMAEYASAKFIAMVVIGFLLFPVFYVWERFFAKRHFVPWELLKERTVLGACITSAVLYFSFYSWDLYYYYFVQVVYNLDIKDTGYMTQIYNVGSCFISPIFGLWVRWTKHFKYTCLCFGLPLMILGAGLMIHFRGSDGDIGYVIMCQIFIAFAGGILVIGNQMAVMSAADHVGVPMMLSILSMMSSIGGAIGQAVGASIYSHTFPKALIERLPADQQANWSTIYLGGSTTQLTYPVGSQTRDAINYAYGYAQKYECIAATAILVLAIPSIAIWKNYNVDRKQVKGNVI